MEKQYIYIFSNSKQPEIVKVGRTNIHPEVRAKNLSNQTGSIGKWRVEWYMVVPDSEIAEKNAHHWLKEFHEEKEFFKLTALAASNKIEKKLIAFFENETTEIWQSESLYHLEKAKMLIKKAKSQELLYKQENKSKLELAKKEAKKKLNIALKK